MSYHSKPRVVVIIPTLNRVKLLRKLINSLASQSLKPFWTIIVDSSQEQFCGVPEDLNVSVIKSVIKSAAVQRNLGIELMLKSEQKFNFCFFLDDDVSLPTNYFENLCKTLERSGVCGVSGLAIGPKESFPSNSMLNRMIGVSGQPGALTKAAVNVPVRSGSVPIKVEWLIGCSGWRAEILDHIRFEPDFVGQSIFEDVLFSVRASKFGSLFVDPSVRINHYLDDGERPSREEYFRQWIRNRFRLKEVSEEKFSFLQYWMTNIAFAIKVTLIDRDLLALKGIIRGMWLVVIGK